MEVITVWIAFGFFYSLVAWLATRKDTAWWFIALVFLSGTFGILVIAAGILVKFVRCIIHAFSRRSQKDFSPEEAAAVNKKRSVLVPVISALFLLLVLAGLYFFLDIDPFSIPGILLKMVMDLGLS